MDRVPVRSSTIAAVGYDPASCTLEVEFTNGRTYQYFDVAEHVHEAMLGGSVSVGRYFNENVRGVYRYARV